MSGGNNFGLNDQYRYLEFQLDSWDNSAGASSTYSPTDWPIFYMGGTPPANVVALKVIEVQIPYSWYSINSTNNTFGLTVTGHSLVTVTLTPGNYTSTTLATELKTKMDAVAPGGHSFTVTYSSSTQKFTITISGGGTFTLTFGSYVNSPAMFLGFAPSETYPSVAANSVVSPNAALVSGPNYLYVNSRRYGQVSNLYLPQGAIGGGVEGPQMAKIPINVGSGGVIYWQDPDPQKWFDIGTVVNLERIDFYLTLGNTDSIIQLNGLSFSLKLGLLSQYQNLTSTHQSSMAFDRVVKKIRPL